MSNHKIFVAVCKWTEKTINSEWVPLYSDIVINNSVIKYDAYGRQFGDSYFQVPRRMQKQEIDTESDIRYYCFEDYGEKTIIYKETGFSQSSGSSQNNGGKMIRYNVTIDENENFVLPSGITYDSILNDIDIGNIVELFYDHQVYDFDEFTSSSVRFSNSTSNGVSKITINSDSSLSMTNNIFASSEEISTINENISSMQSNISNVQNNVSLMQGNLSDVQYRLSLIETISASFVGSVSELPVASESNVGKIYFLTETSGNYIKGKFYICEEENGSYSWELVTKGYPVGNCSNIFCFKKSDSTSVSLKWNDPDNYAINNIEISKWKKTIVVRKVGSYPETEEDGTVVVTSLTKNQYSENPFVDVVPDAYQTYYYGFFPVTEEDVVTLSDGTSNRITTDEITYNILLELSRSGKLSDYMEVGDSIIVNHSEFGEIELQIAGFDSVLPRSLRYVAEDGSTIYVHGLNASVGSTVYSDFDLENSVDNISAVSGSFNIGNSENGKIIVPNEIVVNGKAYECKAHSTTFISRFLLPISANSADSFSVHFDDPELEYAISEDETYQNGKAYYSYDGTSYTELIAGTDYIIGNDIENTVYEKNDEHRKQYGYNMWSQSGIRQYLNSSETSNWWKKQNIFDNPPIMISEKGFLNGMDSDFKNCLGKVICKTANNNIDAGGGFEYTEDIVFLPSVAEILNISLNDGYDGSQFSLCKTLTNDMRKKSTKTSSESSSPLYVYYYLRSSRTDSTNNVYDINSAGLIHYNGAYEGNGLIFLCSFV